MIAEKVELYRAKISGCNPLDLENWIMGLLIHYFFHVSDKTRIEVFGAEPGSVPTVNVLTPTVFKGAGRIRLASNVVFGVRRSPGSYSCSYIEARTPDSLIEIGNHTAINNRASLISEGARIRIGERGLIGPEVQILDSNMHRLVPGQRNLPDDDPQPVEIGDNVFIGSRVMIMKGCRIGEGCVVAAGSVLHPSFVAPPFSIVAGNPARVFGRAPDSPD